MVRVCVRGAGGEFVGKVVGDHFAAELYFACILYGRAYETAIHWWLPVNVDDIHRAHLADERRVEEKGKRVWKRRVKNDLGDCEKNQRVLAGIVEEVLDELRAERATQEATAENVKGVNR